MKVAQFRSVMEALEETALTGDSLAINREEPFLIYASHATPRMPL
ncbi:hypothetical protein GGD83_004427 [Rhodoblastus sphagnicola]|nr:hypothetical protein [Rhodoblastus sphagnicola]